MKNKKKNKLLDGLEEATNYTRTENWAVTYKSTLSSMLDFFAMGGALRQRDEKSVIQLFSKAFHENKALALKALFYFRDIRQGQGERRTFRILLKYLGKIEPELIEKNMENIPFYGRWDDIFALYGTQAEKAMFTLVKSQLDSDSLTEHPSLLAKWMPSEYSGKSKRALAGLIRAELKLTHKEYRKLLTGLRTKINIVETLMASNEWSKIEYSSVPSRASLIYNKAFRRHDELRYEAFLDEVLKAESDVKIKAQTLYPYDIIRKVDKEGISCVKEATALWDSQKDWIGDSDDIGIVVCDTSGSMFGGWARRKGVDPIYISTSLAMYFAERNKGPFHNAFITFSSNPQLQKIVGETIWDKWNNLSKADWAGSTNLVGVWDLILNTGKKYHIPEEEMPKKVFVISDMEFDHCTDLGRSREMTNIDAMKERYAKANYELPTIVFWNVESRQNNVPITKNEQGIVLVSGASPSIFKALMKRVESMGPIDMMLSVLESERYDRVVI